MLRLAALATLLLCHAARNAPRGAPVEPPPRRTHGSILEAVADRQWHNASELIRQPTRTTIGLAPGIAREAWKIWFNFANDLRRSGNDVEAARILDMLYTGNRPLPRRIGIKRWWWWWGGGGGGGGRAAYAIFLMA